MEKIIPWILIKTKGVKEAWKILESLLEQCDAQWLKKYEIIMNDALKNIENTLKYEKLTMKNYKVKPDCPLFKKYFTQIIRKGKTDNPDELIVAHFGWINQSQKTYEKPTFDYLRRSVSIWDDCIKLYYGKKPEDSPYLWSHMEKYIGQMASIFQGLKIDNCSSIPIKVLKYYTQYARSINTNILIISSVFTSNKKTEAIIAKRIGLNAIIRESIYVKSAKDLANNIEQFVKSDARNIFSCEGRNLKKLQSSLPRSIIYDITHDNPAPIAQWNPIAILPLVCTLAMANVPIGSTRGVDEFVPQNLSIIDEWRQYKMVLEEKVKEIKEEKEEETGEVEFIFQGEANQVAVLGSFNNWNKDEYLLQQTNPGIWTTTLNLPFGKHYYKFLLDGKNWVIGLGPTAKDNEGRINNIKIVEQRKLIKPVDFKIYENLNPARSIMNELHEMLGYHRSSFKIYNDVLII